MDSPKESPAKTKRRKIRKARFPDFSWIMSLVAVYVGDEMVVLCAKNAFFGILADGMVVPHAKIVKIEVLCYTGG